MPTPIDLVFAFFFAVVMTVVETYWYFPKFKRGVLAGVPNARRNGYRRTIAGQWGIAAIAIVLWMRSGRSWEALRLAPPTEARLIVSLALIAVMIAFSVHQFSAIGRLSTERQAAIRPRLAFIEFLLPHTREEYGWFTALSFTAGVCEELLYRGFLMWVLQSYIGVVGAVVATVALFGIGHIYQGRQGAVRAGGAALVMSAIAVGTGWLVPAMIVHALLDVNAGVLGFAVLREPVSSRA